MKYFIFILLLSPLISNAQSGTYLLNRNGLEYKLILGKDSSFTYSNGMKKRPKSVTSGVWHLKGDTVWLQYQSSQFTNFTEMRKDSLGNQIMIETRYEIRRPVLDPGIYIDRPYRTHTSIIQPTILNIHLNDNCANPISTAPLGKMVLPLQSIQKISTGYYEYIVTDPRSNYFVVTLVTMSMAPVISSFEPNPKWLYKKGTLAPLECGQVNKEWRMRRYRRNP
jgi:hypothetical protein